MNRALWIRIATAMLLTVAICVPAAVAEDPDDQPSSLVVTADFNRDGLADQARAAVSKEDDAGPHLLTIFLGQPNGTLALAASVPVPGEHPQSMVTGDFNGDGIPDLLLGDADGALLELLGDGTGRLVPAGDIAHLGSVQSIAVGDFNRDGILDIAVSDSIESTVTIFLGQGTGAAGAHPGSFQSTWTFNLPMRGKVYRLASADFNGDGLLDLAVTEEDGTSFQVMLNNGNGTFSYSASLSNLIDPNAHCVT